MVLKLKQVDEGVGEQVEEESAIAAAGEAEVPAVVIHVPPGAVGAVSLISRYPTSHDLTPTRVEEVVAVLKKEGAGIARECGFLGPLVQPSHDQPGRKP